MVVTIEMVMKEQADLLVQQSLKINTLKKQISALLCAIDDNPHPCDHNLVGQIKSAETLLEITK